MSTRKSPSYPTNTGKRPPSWRQSAPDDDNQHVRTKRRRIEKEQRENDENEEEDDKLRSIREEMPFSELREVEKFDTSKHRTPAEQAAFVKEEQERLAKKLKQYKRTKSMPAELSSKIPVSWKRSDIMPVKKQIARDPRFDSLSGRFNSDMFKKSYSFLEQLKTTEMEMLQNEIKSVQDVKERGKLERALEIMVQRQKAEQRKAKQQEIAREWRKGEIERVKHGKNPYFLKKSKIKEIELKQKYDELQSSGRLNTFLKKKRKKTASKNRRSIPTTRRQSQQGDWDY